MIYLDLFLGFLKVGLFSFGGAYSAIPLIRDVVASYGWMDEEMLAYIIAVSESTPGPLMVNLATFVGATKAGILGSAIATLAVILPAFFIIILILQILKNFWNNRYVQAVIRGLAPCMMGTILAMGVFMAVKNVLPGLQVSAFDWRALVLTAVLGGVFFGSGKIFGKKMSPLLLIGISAVLGAVVYSF